MSYQEGQRRRDAAIDRVEDHAASGWKRAARRAAWRCVQDLAEFTTEDIWKRMPAEVKDVREPRAMGAIVRAMLHAGVIVRTNRTRRTSLSQAHCRPMAIWESVR